MTPIRCLHSISLGTDHFFLEGGEKYCSANIFFSICLRKHFFFHCLPPSSFFFHFFFSVLFLGAKYYHCLIKRLLNVINSVVATYFVDICSTRLWLYRLVPYLSVVEERRGAKLLVGSGCQHTKPFSRVIFWKKILMKCHVLDIIRYDFSVAS